jgi:16S rRNA (uracil1498-N3)-methyltransferase
LNAFAALKLLKLQFRLLCPAAMTQRFFVETPITGSQASLKGPEAHHLIHVMRARSGAEVVLFDGTGPEYTARVDRVGRSEVELTVLSRTEVDRELPRELILGVALPKGDRQKWLVEKAVEIGISRLVPLVTQRGVAQPIDQAVVRLERSVIEASKQCGRNRLMQVAGPQEWSEYVAAAPVECGRLMAHQGRDGEMQLPLAGAVYLAIGPEGGFTEDEVTIARAAGWQSVDLGPRILRVETAAVWLAAKVVSNFG